MRKIKLKRYGVETPNPPEERLVEAAKAGEAPPVAMHVHVPRPPSPDLNMTAHYNMRFQMDEMMYERQIRIQCLIRVAATDMGTQQYAAEVTIARDLYEGGATDFLEQGARFLARRLQGVIYEPLFYRKYCEFMFENACFVDWLRTAMDIERRNRLYQKLVAGFSDEFHGVRDR